MKFLQCLGLGLLGTGLGYLVGGSIGATEEERKANAQKGALIGGGSLFLGGLIFIKPKNTVNYTLYDNQGKKVYVGIAYEHRIEERIAEHRNDGKIFNEYTYSEARTRGEALRIEKAKIKKLKPKYNFQHNPLV